MDSSGFVKDGWKAGLWKIIPSSVAGSGVTESDGTVTLATSQIASVNGCFISDYDHYKIIIAINSVSADVDLRFRFRVSGSDNGNASYFYSVLGLTDGGSAANYNGLGAAFHVLGGLDAGQTAGSARALEMAVFNPKQTRKTTLSHHGWGWSQAGAGTFQTGGGAFDANTSFDGFSIYTSNGSATMNGTILVYGFNQ
jgi:hypothetical protein